MFDVYLTDTKKQVNFTDYPETQAVKFILSLKRIFPSVMELLLPILPKDNNLEEMQWESNSRDFEMFKLLVLGWGIIEIRLKALSRYKNRKLADQIVKNVRKKSEIYNSYSSIEKDYLFLHQLHAAIDAELVDIGEKFYLPTLRQLWQGYVSDEVLKANIK